jgi:hypothetical protein
MQERVVIGTVNHPRYGLDGGGDTNWTDHHDQPVASLGHIND